MLCFNAGFSWKSWWISSKECQRPSLPPCGRIRIYSGENNPLLVGYRASWGSLGFILCINTDLVRMKGERASFNSQSQAPCWVWELWLHMALPWRFWVSWFRSLRSCQDCLKRDSPQCCWHSDSKKLRWRDGSMGEGACHQAWRPESDPENLRGRRSESNLTGWPLTSTQVLSHTYAHAQTSCTQ